MSELVQLRPVQEALVERGGKLFAVSVDPSDRSRRVVEKRGLPFAILADTERTVIREYGLVHADAGPGGSDIAIPAHVLIDRDGKIVYRRVSRLIQDRPSPDDDLAAIRTRLSDQESG